ncbi:MAG TPA: PVC-type heme-binding CxxCH protein [Fimbriiglobus sp.]|nr:PVC-type heme-binding CxxCH protein [Fimbriiglobus sp.]
MTAVRLSCVFAFSLVTAAVASAQGLSPEEAVKRMRLPDGFTVRCVASEPMVRQPVSLSFDERGRLWVLQYLQYPNPAGLKPVKQDQYLRTVWDRVPEPPPKGPKGADRLTILYDPDEHGVYRKSRDFVTGLNLATGFCLGNGGVYVVQPPYLLFYPDKDQDDVPDGDPEVLISGFGLNDTHSLANSLQWGPDGWLYGATGSTSTNKITNPANPKEVVEFQQGIWRYHPKTRAFELFSEGGGNTYGLDFDKNGQVIAGTNYGGYAMLHQLQGAYYVKGWSKHGPLHNPHAYGFFEHVPYKGFKGGHVTCGGILYEADAFPKEYRDQYIAGNLLSNAVYWHKLETDGSTFKAHHGGELLETDDVRFRPVDLMLGPDGSVYVADWTDPRAAHLDPIDNWEKANGRVYRIEYQGTPKLPAFDLRKKSSAELVELLRHPNAWWRREARQLLAGRQDATTFPAIKKLIETEKGDAALEAVWALYASGGWSEEYASQWLSGHANPHVRAWYVRLIGDHAGAAVSDATRSTLASMAAADTSPVVVAQLACTAKRLPVPAAKELLSRLILRREFDADPFVPMLVWWAIESKIDADPRGMGEVVAAAGTRKAALEWVERFTRRTLSDARPEMYAAFKQLVESLREEPGWERVYPVVIRAAEAALDSDTHADPHELRKYFAAGRTSFTADDNALLRLLARLDDSIAQRTIRRQFFDTRRQVAEKQRLQWIDTVIQCRGDIVTGEELLGLLAEAETDSFRLGLLKAVEAYTEPRTVSTVLETYPKWPAAVKRRAVSVMLSRPSWAMELLGAIDAGKFPKADVSLDQARAAVGLNDKAVTALVEKHFGKLAPATAGEKQARIAWLNLVINRKGFGDVAKGKALFTKNCAACHTLFGEGGKVGPDLTTADRKNRTYMLTHVVDPSGYIRPEYVAFKVNTLDGRALTGIVTEPAGESVTLLSVVDNVPQKAVVAKKDIDTMTALAVSLMPEKLLDTLTDAEVRDLFAYISSEAPTAAKPAGKKLRVALVSGSLEYKSDESLAAFQKYLEANYPVECVRAFRKTDTDIPGLDQLDSCDVAIFFTRRLKIDGEQLERVKKYVNSGKPVIGIRTASHGFHNWLAMDKLVFGGDYKNHYGAGPKCQVTITGGAKDHPILRGVKPFESVGSLYKNPGVAKDVTVLLTGSIPGHTEPVAWARERKVGGKTQRVFYTSLGHPDDFTEPSFTRLLVNALGWTTGGELSPADR